MRRALRWSTYLAAGLAGLALIALAIIWIRSEHTLQRTWDVPLSDIVFTSDSAAIREGERLARIRGCWDGCHGVGASGGVFFDEPMVGLAVAPDLTRAVRSMSDAELERAIRRGVRADGTSLFVMPSTMFRHLTDDELGAIVAFLRAQTPTDGPDYGLEVRILGRIGVAMNEFPPMAAAVAASSPPALPGPPGSLSQGRHLAFSVCTECHGDDLQGFPGDTPALAVAAAYTPAGFRALMRTGIPNGGRDLGLMKEVALSRFAHFTDEEIDALHAFLISQTAS